MKPASNQARNSNSQSSSSEDSKKLYSSIEVRGKGYINEIIEQPGTKQGESFLFARCSLMMGEEEGKKRYLPVSVLVGTKPKPLMQKVFDGQRFEEDKAQHTLSGLIVDLSFSSVSIDTYETESSVGVNFKGVLSDVAF